MDSHQEQEESRLAILHSDDRTDSMEVSGIGVSPGVAYGKALVIDRSRPEIRPTRIPRDTIDAEVTRFQNAINTSRQQIAALRNQVAEALQEAHAGIYDAHLMMLSDESIVARSIEQIRKRLHNAEFAFDDSVQKLIDRFADVNDPYLKARSADLEDIRQRVLSNLTNQDHERPFDIDTPVIVVARDLTPSDTANMIGKPILAFVTDKGGPTSHAAIMAKALEIPAVVSTEVITHNVADDEVLLVDGDKGRVVVRPDEAMLKQANRSIRLRERREAHRLRLRDLPAETRDGYRIELAANIEFPEELPHVKSHGADGIGLFRTEFLYLNKDRLPTEDELYKVYRDIAKEMAPKSVILRTIDLGGDKLADYLAYTPELNPFLGLRAIRLCLEHPEIFRTQLRAILRATAHGSIKIMYPMVTRVEEIRAARKILRDVKRELRKEGHTTARSIEIGTMIEIPSAALATDILAREVDFFSIGTNDLIQYTLAVDRDNETVAQLYDPLHPSVLRLIQHVITAAHEAGIWVGVCGEMAADPMTAALLVGMGVDELSMASVVIPDVKAVLRSVTFTQTRELANDVLRLPTAAQIRAAVNKRRRQFTRFSL